MRVKRLIGALVAILALGAIATATASAVETLWAWLPGTEGSKYTIDSGKAVLQIKGGSAIECAETSGKGVLSSEKKSDNTLGLITIDFTKCKVATFGFAVNSLGDPSETILAHLETHNCVIKSGDFGILIKPLPVHLEIPALNLLITVEGSFVSLVSPSGKKTKLFTPLIEQKGGVQSIEKCEGGSAETLLSSVDGGTFTQSAEEAEKGLIDFTEEQEIT